MEYGGPLCAIRRTLLLRRSPVDDACSLSQCAVACIRTRSFVLFAMRSRVYLNTQFRVANRSAACSNAPYICSALSLLHGRALAPFNTGASAAWLLAGLMVACRLHEGRRPSGNPRSPGPFNGRAMCTWGLRGRKTQIAHQKARSSMGFHGRIAVAFSFFFSQPGQWIDRGTTALS